jgi:uncharacterized protein YbaA (DUF1428 family)
MQVTFATEPGSADRPNEDVVLATPRLVVVADGAGAPAGLDTGCIHGTAWYVNQLATQIAAGEASAPDSSLTTVLAGALASVARSHADTCNLDADGTPSASVGVLRATPATVDYLVLSDVTLVLDLPSGTEVICDDRIAALFDDLRQAVWAAPAGSAERDARLRELVSTQRKLRNVEGGHWLAGATPDAAAHAIAGAVPRANLRAAAAMTDGAARLVDVFGTITWNEAFTELRTAGPESWIKRTRAIEETDTELLRWPRYKKSDDAALVYVGFSSPGLQTA